MRWRPFGGAAPKHRPVSGHDREPDRRLLPAAGGNRTGIGRNSHKNCHLLIYVAMETGLFRQEELDARFVVLPARALATAELGGTIDFVPLPGSGAKAVVKGAAIFFVVGQSLFSPSMLMVPRQITSVAQLRGQSLGFGQRGRPATRMAKLSCATGSPFCWAKITRPSPYRPKRTVLPPLKKVISRLACFRSAMSRSL